MVALLDLHGKKGLVVGIANEHSIAYGCANIFRRAGAELAISYASDKAEPYVRPLAEQLSASIIMPCDVQKPEQMTALFEAIRKQWGQLDFLLHSIAYAPKADLHGRVTDCSLEGFTKAMDISCHSFIRMARLAEPLMKHGGSMLTVSYIGSQEVVKHYGLMGPVIESGNMLYKQLRYFSGAQGAGIVLGAKVPIILTSRAGDAESRVVSSALALLYARRTV